MPPSLSTSPRSSRSVSAICSFGDSTRGGFFVGVFRLDVHSERDQQDISADLEGSYGLFSASAAMKFNEVRSKFRCDALVSMYHEGGPVDLQITDPTVPSQLLDNADRWLRSFQDDPARNAVPYSVTLAPLTIAEGPLPPNTADIEHAQDVLVLCAKKRSQVLDQINLLSFILAHQSSYDWTGDPTPTPASLDAALNGFEMDLDLVARSAQAWPSTIQRTPLPSPIRPRTWVKHFLLECCLVCRSPSPSKRSRRKFRKPPSLSQMYWTRTSPRRERLSKIWDYKFQRLFKRCRVCCLTLSASRNLTSAALCH